MSEPTPHYPTAAEIRAKKRPREVVPTPELGEGHAICVAVMSARARMSFEAAAADAAREALPGILVSRTAIDPETDARCFTDEDATWINEADWNWVARVTKVAARLNGLAVDSVETVAKN